MTKAKKVEFLREARRLIERGWTTNTMARDGYGNGVDPASDDALEWCAAGALCCVAEVLSGPDDRLAYYRVEDEMNFIMHEVLGDASAVNNLTWFNDRPGRTKEQVLALFDWFIEEWAE